MTISTLTIVALGFVLGTRHATDADHVVAVTTIVSGQRSLRPAALIGALWGIGHTLTILIVGSGIILFKWAIPVRVGLAMELAVGAMLILLGALKLKGSVPVNVHQHGDSIHTHPRAHDAAPHPHSPHDTPLARIDRAFQGLSSYQWLRPVVVGIVHGLAGSAAVALLVLSTIRDPSWAVTYLLVFGVGTIAGMMLLTTAVAIPFVYTNRQFTMTNRRLQMGTGVLSVCFGLLMAYQLSSQLRGTF